MHFILHEQKQVLGTFGSEYELPDDLTAHQWTIMEKPTGSLALIEEITLQLSAAEALASDMIPVVTPLAAEEQMRRHQNLEGSFSNSCEETIL